MVFSRRHASNFPNIPTRFGTATYRESSRAQSTAIACTPYEPHQGHRFNPNKLLLDPYARGHFGELEWHPAVFGFQMESGDDTTFDERDSAPFVPKCVVVDPNFDWKGEHRPMGSYYPL
jgi:pullulanase/glycogen debranching enzyme